jgi:ABC-type glycerol-3-phosphate transport system substrate-binding protein
MIRHTFRLHRPCPGIVLYLLLSIWALPAVYGAAAESLDELHQKARKEGGKLTIYAALSARSMEVILPAFMKRFPGITIDHIDATADKLLARIVAEARGGRVLADVFGGALPYMAQASEQKLLAPLTIPEASAYPAQMKSEFWIATDTQYYIAGWNTIWSKKARSRKASRISRNQNGRTV